MQLEWYYVLECKFVIIFKKDHPRNCLDTKLMTLCHSYINKYTTILNLLELKNWEECSYSGAINDPLNSEKSQILTRGLYLCLPAMNWGWPCRGRPVWRHWRHPGTEGRGCSPRCHFPRCRLHLWSFLAESEQSAEIPPLSSEGSVWPDLHVTSGIMTTIISANQFSDYNLCCVLLVIV